MIPKKIHYCWFGGKEIPRAYTAYIETWKKHCPDYEIIRWDESNYDIHQNIYLQTAYEQKQWSFLSDYVRLDVVYQHGGIYFDTDIELLRSMDCVLYHDAFFAFENDDDITTGLGFGACKGNETVRMLRDMYDSFPFEQAEDSRGYVPCPILVTEGLTKMGFVLDDTYQEIDGVAVYPAEYFNPVDISTKRMTLTDKTIAINHYAGSWLSRKKKLEISLSAFLRRLLGEERYTRTLQTIRHLLGKG